MSFLKKYSIVLLIILLLFVYFRWDQVGSDQENNLKITYKKDRWTSQVWKQTFGIENDILVEKESPIQTEAKIQKMVDKSKTKEDCLELGKWNLEIEKLQKVKNETALAHQLFNDENYVGEYNPEEFLEKDTGDFPNLFDSLEAKEKAHEKAVEVYKEYHLMHIESTNQISDIEENIADLEKRNREKAIDKLSFADGIIRYTLTALWMVLAISFIGLFFLSLLKRKHKKGDNVQIGGD
jgi:hypothetical protein